VLGSPGLELNRNEDRWMKKWVRGGFGRFCGLFLYQLMLAQLGLWDQLH
jgi:hypothetical protein